MACHYDYQSKVAGIGYAWIRSDQIGDRPRFSEKLGQIRITRKSIKDFYIGGAEPSRPIATTTASAKYPYHSQTLQ